MSRIRMNQSQQHLRSQKSYEMCEIKHKLIKKYTQPTERTNVIQCNKRAISCLLLTDKTQKRLKDSYFSEYLCGILSRTQNYQFYTFVAVKLPENILHIFQEYMI
jgi:hypothetical protein